MSREWVTTTTILHDLKNDAQSEAWTRLVTRFQRPIAGFAKSMGLSSIDSEEVAQETLLAFLSSYRAGKYDRERGRLNKWLFGIAYRQVLRQRKKSAGREVLIGGNESAGGFWNELPDEDAATKCFDRQWEQALLDECLLRARVEFEPATFRAFELTVQQGIAAPEAAASLGLPVKAVYNAKHRVLKRIRELRADLAEIDP